VSGEKRRAAAGDGRRGWGHHRRAQQMGAPVMGALDGGTTRPRRGKVPRPGRAGAGPAGGGEEVAAGAVAAAGGEIWRGQPWQLDGWRDTQGGGGARLPRGGPQWQR
jgi:hypothetical protein